VKIVEHISVTNIELGQILHRPRTERTLIKANCEPTALVDLLNQDPVKSASSFENYSARAKGTLTSSRYSMFLRESNRHPRRMLKSWTWCCPREYFVSGCDNDVRLVERSSARDTVTMVILSRLTLQRSS